MGSISNLNKLHFKPATSVSASVHTKQTMQLIKFVYLAGACLAAPSVDRLAGKVKKLANRALGVARATNTKAAGELGTSLNFDKVINKGTGFFDGLLDTVNEYRASVNGQSPETFIKGVLGDAVDVLKENNLIEDAEAIKNDVAVFSQDVMEAPELEKFKGKTMKNVADAGARALNGKMIKMNPAGKLGKAENAVLSRNLNADKNKANKVYADLAADVAGLFG